MQFNLPFIEVDYLGVPASKEKEVRAFIAELIKAGFSEKSIVWDKEGVTINTEGTPLEVKTICVAQGFVVNELQIASELQFDFQYRTRTLAKHTLNNNSSQR